MSNPSANESQSADAGRAASDKAKPDPQTVASQDQSSTLSFDALNDTGHADPQGATLESDVQAGSANPTLELEQLRAQLKSAQEQVLRGMADMENMRKRTAIEVTNAHKYAVESFAEALVPVLDSLELSLKVDKPTVETLKEGAEATLRLLHAAFERNHLQAIEPVGERFDPNRHQAISMVSGSSVSPPVSPNHVVTVLQKGYLIHDRVLRPALVTVAQA
ncbi:MAG: nucleotide exchange factor GrpE [Burkholderiaceae bacterium]